ncbi:hypothetical protein [Parasphingorhabdus sp.]|uniref:hypothetical protein n=1 Tax=Parasphingorhabdus sp. TaxID=2709688 RepID=UPI003264994C
MQKYITSLLVIATLLASSGVNAAAWCQGNITNIVVHNNGAVNIYSTWRSAWTVICNVKTEWKDVPSEVCFTWFSIANTSIVENKTAVAYYPAIEQADCATMDLNTSAPGPGYLRLNQY